MSEDEILSQLNPFVINCVHGDHVSELPADITSHEAFQHHAGSERTPHELWTYGDRVLCMQAHPELTTFLIQKFIIERLAGLGGLDTRQRAEAERQLKAGGPLRRLVMIRIIAEFIRQT